ncbi:MAG: fumarylacetoacetate hydrolase family protein [Ktedonobacteraceae bacterium]
MRLITFVYQGKQSYGIVLHNDAILDLGPRLGDRAPDVRAALTKNLLPEIASLASQAQADIALSEVTLLPVIPNPAKIFCIGLNYDDHRREAERAETRYPTIFTRFADSQTGHLHPLLRPAASQQLDYEGELAVIVGKRGRAINAAQAFEYIAGYSCYNDATVRDWQHHTHQWTPGKNFPSTGGFGPWMVTADEIEDGSSFSLVTRLNGQEMQRATTDAFIFPVPELMAYISTFTPLSPGDVICTGTPGGVGFKRKPAVFLQAGDIVEVEISHIGTLRNPIVDESAESAPHAMEKERA